MLDTVTRNGGVSAQETLASQGCIQALKEREALLIQEIALLAPNDPRRGPIQAGLTSMRAEIASETDKIIASIKRDTEVARSTVAALEFLGASSHHVCANFVSGGGNACQAEVGR